MVPVIAIPSRTTTRLRACLAAFLLLAPMPLLGQIDVFFQGGVALQNGSSKPSFQDGTDFGSLNVASGSSSHRFQIVNRLQESLSLRLDLLLPAEGFEITPAIDVGPGGTAEVMLTFDPSDAGHRDQRVRISGDPAGPELSFVFLVRGLGLGAEIELSGMPDGDRDGIPIQDGDRDPSAGAGTDFGPVTVGDEKVHRFRIRNLGTSPLNVDDRTSNDQFTITGLPASIIPGAYSDFEITFAPTLLGDPDTAEVELTTNDSNEGLFSFTIRGQAQTEPNILVTHGQIPIPSGSSEISLGLNTNFGMVGLGGGFTRRFTIRNSGSRAMHLSAVATDHPDYTVQPIGSFIGAGASGVLDIRFQPALAGTTESTVRLSSDDPDTPEYTFRIGGGAFEATPFRIEKQELVGAGEEARHLVHLRGDRGYQYQLEYSLDMVHWSRHQVLIANIPYGIVRNGENQGLVLDIAPARIRDDPDAGGGRAELDRYFLRVLRRPVFPY